MKKWEKAIHYKWSSGSSHVFLLHLNVHDDLINSQTEKFESLAEYLVSSTVVGEARFVAFFNRGSDITFGSKEKEKEFLEFLAALHPEPSPRQSTIPLSIEDFCRKRKDPEYALMLFTEMLHISREVGEYLSKIETSAGYETENDTKKPFFVAVLDYIETLVPPDAATTSHECDRDSLVLLEVWARDRLIREAGNIAIVIGDSINLIAPQLRSESSGVTPLKLEFPDVGEREKTICIVRSDSSPNKDDIPAEELSHLTAGMTRMAIANLIKESNAKGKPLTAERVFSYKKKIIEEQSGGLLKVIQPLWGIEVIGGLEEHKKYIKEVVHAMRQNDPLAVPMGILLLGAPGTGKTVFAEAVAHEAGIPFVKMKNIREMWVGQSERNQDLALEIVKALAPVVVFVDEIDQQFQSRDTMFDNTGVNNRLQAQLFEFMSDTDLRGKVLWIAASNRPDLLDAALLRTGRFDEKIPFFPPSRRERSDILAAILRKMKIQHAPLSWKISDDFFGEFGWLSHWHKGENGLDRCDPDTHSRKKEDKSELPLTGADIEAVVAVAYRYKAGTGDEYLAEKHILKALNEHIPNPDFAKHEKMTDLAILYCNSERFIPEGIWKERAKILHSYQHTGRDTQTRIL